MPFSKVQILKYSNVQMLKCSNSQMLVLPFVISHLSRKPFSPLPFSICCNLLLHVLLRVKSMVFNAMQSCRSVDFCKFLINYWQFVFNQIIKMLPNLFSVIFISSKVKVLCIKLLLPRCCCEERVLHLRKCPPPSTTPVRK